MPSSRRCAVSNVTKHLLGKYANLTDLVECEPICAKMLKYQDAITSDCFGKTYCSEAKERIRLNQSKLDKLKQNHPGYWKALGEMWKRDF